MLTEERIRNIASSHNAYLKGYDLYEFNKVRLMTKLNKNGITNYKFKVDGKNVSFSIDENDNIDNIKCQCFEYGVCKEMVASLLYIIANDPKKKLEELLKNKKSSISQ